MKNMQCTAMAMKPYYSQFATFTMRKARMKARMTAR